MMDKDYFKKTSFIKKTGNPFANGYIVGFLLLLMMCGINIYLHRWLDLFCNTLWLFICYTSYLLSKRLTDARYEILRNMIYIQKLHKIIFGLATELGKETEVFDKMYDAGKEAFEESQEKKQD